MTRTNLKLILLLIVFSEVQAQLIYCELKILCVPPVFNVCSAPIMVCAFDRVSHYNKNNFHA